MTTSTFLLSACCILYEKAEAQARVCRTKHLELKLQYPFHSVTASVKRGGESPPASIPPRLSESLVEMTQLENHLSAQNKTVHKKNYYFLKPTKNQTTHKMVLKHAWTKDMWLQTYSKKTPTLTWLRKNPCIHTICISASDSSSRELSQEQSSTGSTCRQVMTECTNMQMISHIETRNI